MTKKHKGCKFYIKTASNLNVNNYWEKIKKAQVFEIINVQVL